MMKWKISFALAGSLGTAATLAADMGGHMHSDPVLAKFMIDKLEVRDVEGDNPVKWDVEGWLGKDLDKFWLKSEGRYADGGTAAAELQLLYHRAIAPYWDLQMGWRGDLEPDPQRDWLALGVQGTAPYLVEMDAALFIGEEGRSALRFKADYEWRLTRRLILVPDLEANAYGEDDPERGTGSGLSDLSVGLRLHYQILRQFAPYVGVEGRWRFGATEEYARAGGEEDDNAWLVAGVSAWF